MAYIRSEGAMMDSSKYVDELGILRFSDDGSEVFPGATGVPVRYRGVKMNRDEFDAAAADAADSIARSLAEVDRRRILRQLARDQTDRRA